MAVINRDTWEQFLQSHLEAHILQTPQWGDFKSWFGWTPRYIQAGDSGAMVLFRQLPLNHSMGYIPKGPVGNDWPTVLKEAIEIAIKSRAIVLYLEPDIQENHQIAQELIAAGLKSSWVTIQPRRSLVISLNGSENDWLNRMKQKTRYNIRLAQKSGVVIEMLNDVDIFNQLMQQTGERGEFGIHKPEYYQRVFEQFSKGQKCSLFIARYNQTPLAGLMVFRHGNRAWYFYGASSSHERQRMPAYLLQWEAMCWAAHHGCTQYDLWGVPDEPYEVLEKYFTSRSDGLWGVYRFKRGFGGELIRSAGVYEKELCPLMYRIFRLALKARKGAFS